MDDAMKERGRRFLHLMKRYCIDYVNVGDQSVTKDLMVDDYVLHMGLHQVRGRDTAYYDATRKQMQQYPGLMLTVHEIATNGMRGMMRFSEHGRREKDGRECAWGGIALYTFDGERLVDCHVEQDYVSRLRQVATGSPDKVDHPAVAPWGTAPLDPDAGAENVVRRWLKSGVMGTQDHIWCDESWQTGRQSAPLEQNDVEILTILSAGRSVGFRIRQIGKLAAGGDAADLYAAGIVHVDGGQVSHGRIIRNRIELTR